MAETKEVTISEAVVKALSEMPNAKKTGEGKIKGEGKAGYYEYDYQYAELDKILAIATPIFAKHDLAIMQDVKTENGSIGAKTIFLHGASGSRMESSWLMLPGGHAAQSYGSAESYARRYSLMAFLGIAAEDDDGAAATESASKQKSVGNTPAPSDGPPPEKKEKTPGGASFKSLGLARGLFIQRAIAIPPENDEPPDVTERRREQNCFAIAEWLKDRGFESNGHDDELLHMNQVRLSQVIDKVKAEIADMDVG